MIKYVIHIVLSFVLLGCSYFVEPEPVGDSPLTVFKEAWQVADENYPFFEFKNIQRDSLYKEYSLKAQEVRGDEILILLQELLGELKDGHVWFYTRGGVSIRTYIPPRQIRDRRAFSLLVVNKFFPEPLKSAGRKRLFYGMLEGNIGYVYISTFVNDNSRWYMDFREILWEMKDTRGLILDVRHNGGGSDLVTDFIVSLFLNQPLKSPLWIDVSGDTLPRLMLYPNGDLQYLKPVVVLQNGVCFSATEGFINMIKEIPHVTTVGDTTAGGGGAPQDFKISGEITIHLSTRAQLNYNGDHIEWNGIPPDILIRQSEQDIRNDRDPQLEFAIRLIKSN